MEGFPAPVGSDGGVVLGGGRRPFWGSHRQLAPHGWRGRGGVQAVSVTPDKIPSPRRCVGSGWYTGNVDVPTTSARCSLVTADPDGDRREERQTDRDREERDRGREREARDSGLPG